MYKSVRTLALVAALGVFSMPAWAQENPEESSDASDVSPETAPAAAEPASNEPVFVKTESMPDNVAAAKSNRDARMEAMRNMAKNYPADANVTTETPSAPVRVST